jgi:hypothetical protein
VVQAALLLHLLLGFRLLDLVLRFGLNLPSFVFGFSFVVHAVLLLDVLLDFLLDFLLWFSLSGFLFRLSFGICALLLVLLDLGVGLSLDVVRHLSLLGFAETSLVVSAASGAGATRDRPATRRERISRDRGAVLRPRSLR